jgi:hypothetical protein
MAVQVFDLLGVNELHEPRSTSQRRSMSGPRFVGASLYAVDMPEGRPAIPRELERALFVEASRTPLRDPDLPGCGTARHRTHRRLGYG